MRAVYITNRGGRENNEDFINYARYGNIWCFVICDGLGGHAYGEVASEAVARAVCDEFTKNPQIDEDALREYLTAAAQLLAVKRGENEAMFEMSTTVTALITDGKKAVWGHAGDSRLYYLKGGKIKSVTDDHSIAFMEYENGSITYDDIRRSPAQNRLIRCVGNIDEFLPDITHVTEISAGDAFLLCTDGFWEYVTEDDMEKTLKETSSPKNWLSKMLEILHENEVRNNDNYSAIAVMV